MSYLSIPAINRIARKTATRNLEKDEKKFGYWFANGQFLVSAVLGILAFWTTISVTTNTIFVPARDFVGLWSMLADLLGVAFIMITTGLGLAIGDSLGLRIAIGLARPYISSYLSAEYYNIDITKNQKRLFKAAIRLIP